MNSLPQTKQEGSVIGGSPVVEEKSRRVVRELGLDTIHIDTNNKRVHRPAHARTVL